MMLSESMDILFQLLPVNFGLVLGFGFWITSFRVSGSVHKLFQYLNFFYNISVLCISFMVQTNNSVNVR